MLCGLWDISSSPMQKEEPSKAYHQADCADGQ